MLAKLAYFFSLNFECSGQRIPIFPRKLDYLPLALSVETGSQ